MRHLMLAFPVLLLALSACGSNTEALEPMQWPFLETPSKLSINGQSYDAWVATTEAHRKRALNGLAIKQGQAIALLYPKLEKPAEIKFRMMADPAEIVFLDESGKTLAVETVPAFSQGAFPHAFAHDGARVVLQLPLGSAKSLNITKGATVKTEPDVLKQADSAEGEFARLYFYHTIKEDEKPVDYPFVSLKVLEKAEDCARGLKDRPELKEGEGVIMPVSGFHEFWLKGVEGKVCAAYIERTQGAGTVITAMYEGIEDTGSNDLERPVYYGPSGSTYLAIWKGADTFTKHKIERRARVVLAGVEASTQEKPEMNDLAVKFGDVRLSGRIARTPSERATALAEAPVLKAGKAVVLAWDDPADVAIEGVSSGANLWFVNHDGGNKYSVGEKVTTTGEDVKVAAKSRFVIAVPPGFAADGALDLPWIVRDLQPWLPAIAFYNAKERDIVRDRWPTAKDNLRKTARVELAVTDAEQRRGLMYRTSLKKDHGMLFIYKEEQEELSYWMKNCKMNLSIAFVNERGEIVSIHNSMKAPAASTPDHMLESYKSDFPAKYAVEMEENWFEKNGISKGDRLFLPPELAAIK